MQAALLTPHQRAAAPALAQSVRTILLTLATIIARAFLRDPVHVALILPLWRRFHRLANRFDRLMARIALGTEPAQNRRAARPRALAATPAPAVPAYPRRYAWLLAALRHEAGTHTQRLQTLLSNPEIAAIVAATPRAASLLRPLCHMLGVRHPALRRAPRSTPPRPTSAPRTPRCGTRKPALHTLCDVRPPPPDAPPRPLAETAPCPHVFWPWFPRPSARTA